MSSTREKCRAAAFAVVAFAASALFADANVWTYYAKDDAATDDGRGDGLRHGDMKRLGQNH